MSELRVVTLNGSYSEPSRTGALLELVADTVRDRWQQQDAANTVTTNVEISHLPEPFGSAHSREELSPGAAHAVEAVENADLLIAGSPVFRGSYSGLFKHFMDMVDQYALAAKPVLLVASGGSARHALMIDQELRPLFAFFQAATAPVGVYASSGDFAGTTLLDPEAYARIDTAVDDIVPLLIGRAAQRQR